MSSSSVPSLASSGVTPSCTSISPSMDVCQITLHEVVSTNGPLISVGSILSLLDLAAGRCAHHYVRSPCVTVSFERVRFHSRVEYGGLITAVAGILAVGASSMLIESHAYIEDITTGTKSLCAEAFVTFVAVGDAKGIVKVPRLKAESNEQNERVQNGVRTKNELTSERKKLAAMDNIPREELLKGIELYTPQQSGNTGINGSFTSQHIDKALLQVCKQYLPRHENFGGIVFGGDLLETMERFTNYCARRFVKDEYMVTTVGIHYVTFKKSMDPMNLLRINVRVCGVKGALVFVHVEALVYKDKSDASTQMLSNEGLFALLCTDQHGNPKTVRRHLHMENASQQALIAHAKALLWLNTESFDEYVLCKERNGSRDQDIKPRNGNAPSTRN